jgi:hypothetical protein
MTERADVLLLGDGLAGLATALRLTELGIDRWRIGMSHAASVARGGTKVGPRARIGIGFVPPSAPRQVHDSTRGNSVSRGQGRRRLPSRFRRFSKGGRSHGGEACRALRSGCAREREHHHGGAAARADEGAYVEYALEQGSPRHAMRARWRPGSGQARRRRGARGRRDWDDDPRRGFGQQGPEPAAIREHAVVADGVLVRRRRERGHAPGNRRSNDPLRGSAVTPTNRSAGPGSPAIPPRPAPRS